MSLTHKRTIRTLSHCFYDLKYHLVWAPKYRGKTFGIDEFIIRRYVKHQYHHNQSDEPSLFSVLK